MRSILGVFTDPDTGPDHLRCAELLVGGRERAERWLTQTLRRLGVGEPGGLAAVCRGVVDAVVDLKLSVTGAEAVAALLADGGVTDVFCYAGTSEIALCDAVDRAGGVRLINGRGDKESAFMAAGASLLEPGKGAAILHGARGLTNATGGVADARRSEAGALFIVGLPSSGSVRFLPPHAEPDLIDGIGAFADWNWQAPPVPGEPAERAGAARQFVTQLRRALGFIVEPPTRPAIFGIPQDVAERRWIPIEELAARPAGEPSTGVLEDALRLLADAERPLLLVDDYALRYSGIRQALDGVSRAVGAPVLQLRYRRGPMLFERLRGDEVANFVGWLDQFDPVHRRYLDSCDLLVTVEDRNIYERVVGRLPHCRKVAVNSDVAKAVKNEYLAEGDILLPGDPARVLGELSTRLAELGDRRVPWFSRSAGGSAGTSPEPASRQVDDGRRAVAAALAGALGGWDRPVLVDDSQMFGGLLSEYYDEFPPGLRVFGGHGAFVGGGLAYATGLAIANPDVRVMCTLGDQAFTNSFQGLVAAVQQRARVLFVVCNNGESVSLNKQAAASFGATPRSYLSNVDGFEYHAVVGAFGIPSERVAVPIGGPPDDVALAVSHLSKILTEVAAVDGPALVELVLPSDTEVWRGIWLTQGFEEAVALR